jgi:hypothetical protein
MMRRGGIGPWPRISRRERLAVQLNQARFALPTRPRRKAQAGEVPRLSPRPHASVVAAPLARLRERSERRLAELRAVSPTCDAVEVCLDNNGRLLKFLDKPRNRH